MMFDNPSPTPPSTRHKLGEQAAMALVVGGAFAAAIGMHFGSLTVVAVGVTLLIVGGAAAALRSRRSTRSTGTKT